MPPVPQALPRPIQAEMDTLRKQYHSLDSLIGQLRNLSGSTLAVHQDLSRTARDESRAIEAKIEELRLLSDEQDREADRTLMLAMLEKIEAQYKQQQQSLRQAVLTSKQTIDQEARAERELLFKGSKSAIELGQVRRRAAANGDTGQYLLNTSKEQNESLSRTLQLMQQEVERTAHSARVIDESSRTLRETVNEYRTYDEVLKRGKNLITKLNQADWIDRLLIGFGLLLFSLVVTYILKKRIADRGISLISYLFMPIRWMSSLLDPSFEAPSPTLTPEASITTGIIVQKATESAAKEFVEQLQRTATALAGRTAPTSVPRGILGVLDAIVGE
ncbi:Sec20-domain-containing protein [Mortierella sp. GBAus27b]|nr:Sec20-domain-containing protein [Mortierella sp. GBAus27b]